MSEEGTFIVKELVIPVMVVAKERYDAYGIIKSVNINAHMNECKGKAKAKNKHAVQLIDDFIEAYMQA